MVNMLTYFVNIHALSSIKHTMRNSRVTWTIADKNEETTQYVISVIWYHSWPPVDFLRNLWEGEYSLQCYVCFVQGKINHGQVLYMNVTRV